MLSFLLISFKALTDQVHVNILFDEILLDDTSLRAIIAKNLPPNFCFKADVSVMLITNESNECCIGLKTLNSILSSVDSECLFN